MRLIISLAIVALAAAAPASAQNEAVAPATGGEVNAVDSNLVAPAPADPATTPVTDPAPLPADTDLAAAETDIAADNDGDDHDRGFPWGLVGLVGLVGLLGRRRSD
jgi:MYXO-CTERM domain-containing protein